MIASALNRIDEIINSLTEELPNLCLSGREQYIQAKLDEISRATAHVRAESRDSPAPERRLKDLVAEAENPADAKPTKHADD